MHLCESRTGDGTDMNRTGDGVDMRWFSSSHFLVLKTLHDYFLIVLYFTFHTVLYMGAKVWLWSERTPVLVVLVQSNSVWWYSHKDEESVHSVHRRFCTENF